MALLEITADLGSLVEAVQELTKAVREGVEYLRGPEMPPYAPPKDNQISYFGDDKAAQVSFDEAAERFKGFSPADKDLMMQHWMGEKGD